MPKGKVIMREGEPVIVGKTIRLEHIEEHKEALHEFFKQRWKDCEEDGELIQGALPHALVRNGVAYLNEIYGPEGTIEILEALIGMLKRGMNG